MKIAFSSASKSLSLVSSAIVFAALTGFTAVASATPIDVSAVVTKIDENLTPVSLIGLSVLSFVVVVRVFKWLRSAI